jgi:hypothetical protein
MSVRSVLVGIVGSAGLAALISCSSDPAPPPADPMAIPAACRDVTVDPFKELMVVDEAVMTDRRASNGSNGAWSFRHAIEELTPPGRTPSQFVTAWLATFRQPTSISVYDVPPRDIALVDELLTCPWLRRTPANGCDARCSTCTARELDLATAPFRLIAIANRVDLRETSADLGGTGEGRLVFGLTDGAADDPASKPLRMSVIFEFHLPDSQANAAGWARRWHALGSHSAFDEGYRSELEALTESFVRRGAAPGRSFGSALAQMRSNERELDWTWDLREFRLSDSTGRLELEPVFNTPDRTLNASSQLGDWAKANREAVLKNQHVVPRGFLGGFAQPHSTWQIPSADEALRKALATQTCDGCHQTEQPSLDINFHVSPFRKGIEKLSPFVFNPNAPTDELRIRADAMRRALCSSDAQ